MSPVPASQAAEPRAEQLRLQILADAVVYEGFVTLVDGERVQEALNDPKPFLTLTDVVIQDRNAATAHHAPFLALNKGAITHVVLLSAEAEATTSHGARGAGKRASSSISTQAAAAAAQPTVPPAGPRTLPAPPPAPRAVKEPPTQPFPKIGSSADVDDVGDLILDDDGGDDIDPDDLERDVGALIAGAAAE